MSQILFSVMFTAVFLLVFGMIIASVIRSTKTWHRNNQSPRLTVHARVVSRRTDIQHHPHANADTVTSFPSTTYYATFEVESGDRMEFRLSGQEYGMLYDGDVGRLSFQGTRFLGFTRS